MGLFDGNVINVMRNNLSVGIVCMMVDSGSNSNNNSNNASTQKHSLFTIDCFCAISQLRKARSYSAMNDQFENCPKEVTSDEGYGEVNLMFFVGKIIYT